MNALGCLGKCSIAFNLTSSYGLHPVGPRHCLPHFGWLPVFAFFFAAFLALLSGLAFTLSFAGVEVAFQLSWQGFLASPAGTFGRFWVCTAAFFARLALVSQCLRRGRGVRRRRGGGAGGTVLVLLWGAGLVFLREANTVAASQWTTLARSLGRKQRPCEPLPKPRAGFLPRLIPPKRKRMAQLLCGFF